MISGCGLAIATCAPLLPVALGAGTGAPPQPAFFPVDGRSPMINLVCRDPLLKEFPAFPVVGALLELPTQALKSQGTNFKSGHFLSNGRMVAKLDMNLKEKLAPNPSPMCRCEASAVSTMSGLF